MTEHSGFILAGAWPGSSEMAWGGLEMELKSRGRAIAGQYDTQLEIRQGVQHMSGPFIDGAGIPLASKRETTLQESAKTDHTCSSVAESARLALTQAKNDMVDIVQQAEKDITAKRQKAATAKAELRAMATPLTAAAVEAKCQAIDAQLEVDEHTIEVVANLSAKAVNTTSAAEVAGYGSRVTDLTLTYPASTGTGSSSSAATPMSAGGLGSAPAPAAPAPAVPVSGGEGGVQSVGYDVGDSGETNTTELAANNSQNGVNAGSGTRNTPHIEPASAVTNDAGTPASGASQGASGGSVLGKMMSPLSSLGSGGSAAGGGSPLSSMSSMGSGLGNFGNAGGASPAGAQPASMLNPGAAAMPGAGLGTGAGTGAGAGAGGGSGLAGLGAGAAETSAKLAAGAVNSVSNGLGAVANAGSQVAQNVAPVAAQLAAQTAPVNPAAATSPASMGGMGGAPPMGMMPPGGSMGGAPPVSPVSGGGSGLTPPPAPAAPPAGGGGPSTPSIQGGSPGAQFAPVGLPQQHHPGIRGVDAGGASGAVLIDRAMAAGADVITALLAQTTLAGHIGIDYAVSLIYERTGGVTAWLATSEGASYVPMGVRIPQDVKLAINDRILGTQLRAATAEAGGANPLQVIVEHAKAREMAGVGTHVLAIASSIKMANQMEWAHEVSAQPVEVLAAKFATFEGASAAAANIGHTHHRCEISMPWEWQQANSFDNQGRLRIAAKYMHLAMSAGGLNGAASEEVLRLFEMRAPISDELWGKVQQERLMALVEYDTAKSRISYGAPGLARLLAKARAAEVMESLRHYDTAEGFADLLYATRLAGAPLSPADAAVAA
ncbi:hypothetical protein [Mycobacterium sp.]|uniref:hypothetical protein n=1 Tax=Mycobacterium sp. TaxID=1785 RepID=UPI0025F55E81|nr:hypothetical protein [Mycobacterium sp.]